jgi:molybdate transport system substrate-binding protein
LAIANPRHAPYGRAAEEALRKAGLLPALEDRLVLGENVAQAAHFVRSGAADAGIVALSIALSPAMRDSARCAPLPADSHAPLLQGGVILKGARDVAAAEAFRDLLTGPEGRAILSRFGLSAPLPAR